MRTRLSVVWSKAVTVRLRPRACARRVRGVVVVTGVLLVGAAALGALPMQSDVRLAAEGESASPFTVELTAIDGAPPFDPGDGPGLDTGPSNGIVREGDPVTYVVDIGVRATRSRTWSCSFRCLEVSSYRPCLTTAKMARVSTSSGYIA